MVCHHCVRAVEQILRDVGAENFNVELGKATLEQPLSDAAMDQLVLRLRRDGFELIADRESEIVEKTKHAILHHVREEKKSNTTFQSALSGNLV